VPRPVDGVFINVPFDRPYRKLFHALVFAVHDCGFVARCALEEDDGSQVRMEKLYAIIRDCALGIHDLSRVTLDAENRLPRFNMPLELGIFLGAKRYGDRHQKRKSCLILERDRYRYQKFCSDLSGQDVREHHNDVFLAIAATRNWLHAARSSPAFPSAKSIEGRYLAFRSDLPAMCAARKIDRLNPEFLDYRTLVSGWRAENQTLS
jgi:hypothetical protein